MRDLTAAIEAAADNSANTWPPHTPRHVVRQVAAQAIAAAAPLIEAAARADERTKTAEDIAKALLDVDPIEWALAGQSAGEDAAAIARQHAQETKP